MRYNMVQRLYSTTFELSVNSTCGINVYGYIKFNFPNRHAILHSEVLRSRQTANVYVWSRRTSLAYETVLNLVKSTVWVSQCVCTQIEIHRY